MAGETSPSTPAMPQDGAGASSGVSGTADSNMVSADDVRALQSKLDKQIADQQRTINEMQQRSEQERMQQIKDLTPTDQVAAYEAELGRYKQKEAEEAARQTYAATVATATGVDASLLAGINDPSEMLRVATEKRVQDAIASAGIAPSAGSTMSPAPSGATLIEPVPDKNLDEIRAEAFKSGDMSALSATFLNGE